MRDLLAPHLSTPLRIGAVTVLVVAVAVLVVLTGTRRRMPSPATPRTGFPDPVETADGGCLLTEDAVGHECAVRIVHVSDTHGRHDEVTERLPPAAELLIHTGDFCDEGTPAEFAGFNRWVGEVKGRFRLGVYVILGNHDYKFLDGLGAPDELIATLASDEARRAYLRDTLPNAVVLDHELRRVAVAANVSLTLFASPWNPWQSSPTHVDRVLASGTKPKTDHDRAFEAWRAAVPRERRRRWADGEAWRYDEIPAGVDVLLTHVPPFGVLDRMPVVGHWGSSRPLRARLRQSPARAVLFGHVHAQRGYWERTGRSGTPRVVGGVQYAAVTDEEGVGELMGGRTGGGVQFMANSALMSDRSVQPFAKKRIVGPPRLIVGRFTRAQSAVGGGSHDREGEWHFHDVNPM